MNEANPRHQTSCSMPETSLGGDDLEGLMRRASAALSAQCGAAYQELQQTQGLLADATRALLDCFQAANRELETLGSDPGVAAQVSRRLLAASQHLQFSDLVGQLLVNTQQRVDALAQVSARLASLMAALRTRPDPTGQQANAALAAEKRAVLDAITALETSGHNRVRQASMEAGSVDLF